MRLGEPGHSRSTIRPRKASFSKGKNIPDCCCRTIWLLILFILVCGMLFWFVTLKGWGQEKGRFQMEVNSPNAVALGFETTWVISSQDIPSRTPTSIWAASHSSSQTHSIKSSGGQAGPLGYPGHPSRFQRPSCSFTPEGYLAGSGACTELRTVMRPEFCQGQNLPAHLARGSCILL